MLFVSFCYLLFAILLLIAESFRIKKRGPDFFHLFIILLSIQDIIPPLVILYIKLHHGLTAETGNIFIDEVLSNLSFNEAAIVFVLLALFVFSSYFCYFLICDLLLCGKAVIGRKFLDISRARWFVVMLIGVCSSFVLLHLVGGFGGIVKLRLNPFGPDRGFWAAKCFSLTLPFFYLSLFGLFKYWDRKISVQFSLSLLLTLFMGAMTASRRPIALLFIFLLFTCGVKTKKIYYRYIILASILVFPVVIIGKNFLWSLSYKGYVDFTTLYTMSFSDAPGTITKFLADIGRSTTESWGTLLYLKNISPRLGIDHMLSVLRRIPDGALGLTIPFPERIVRVSTRAFLSADSADIPPGFFGQMWLDFRYSGPVLYGLFYGSIIACIQKVYERFITSLPGTYVFVLVCWIISMPLTSGTWDFVFSFEMFLFLLFCLFILNIRIINRETTLADNTLCKCHEHHHDE